MIVNILLVIACSLDPQGSLCQAYGGPCVILQSACVSIPTKSSVERPKDIIDDRKQRQRY